MSAPDHIDPFASAIDVSELTFSFSTDGPQVLRGIDLKLERGDRCLLIGANGAGKSTLLQILAGKRLVKSRAKVFGQDVFFKRIPSVCYLGTEWAANPVVRSDVVVSHFLDSVGGYRYKERRDQLLDILDIDLDWHMHQISDGERRRVQICQGLMAPWDLLLLDEVTVDLDVLVRSQLLDFLKQECKTRNATVLYATHIYDGLDKFPTKVCHIQLGSTTTKSPIPWPLPPKPSFLNDVEVKKAVPEGVLEKMEDPERAGSRLLELAVAWLREDRKMRLELEKSNTEGFRSRGARTTEETRDSETFYRKYDYSS